MFFGGGESEHAREKYRLVIECARFADQKGFTAIWLPERHFTRLGCLYPNPAVLHAALARETRRIRLRAGSVVLPLHHPVRVAEEWSVVDNLSDGRVEISFAPGWNPEDFVLAPQGYDGRHEAMFAAIETVERLWSGEAIRSQAGDGSWVEVRTAPRPIQSRLPKWVTAAANPATFRRAGQTGAHLLHAPLRLERRPAGGNDRPVSRRPATVRPGTPTADVSPLRYTPSWPTTSTAVQPPVLPAFLRLLEIQCRAGRQAGAESRNDRRCLQADRPSARRRRGSSLREIPERPLVAGDARDVRPQVEQLVKIGVNEVACLLDFGPEPDAILGELESLDRLRRGFAEPAPLARTAVAAGLLE